MHALQKGKGNDPQQVQQQYGKKNNGYDQAQPQAHIEGQAEIRMFSNNEGKAEQQQFEDQDDPDKELDVFPGGIMFFLLHG